jgi:hypothetical protein
LLMLMPKVSNSTARLRVNIFIPPLLTQYAGEIGKGEILMYRADIAILPGHLVFNKSCLLTN